MDNIFEDFIARIHDKICWAIDLLVQKRLDELEATTLNASEVADMLKMKVETFRKYQREYEELGFPEELPGKRWKKLAVIDWMKK